MEFSFKNIGLIEDAKINLSGLTVLTGLNDTGKSFINKAIYSIIKTNKDAFEQAQIVKIQVIQQAFSQLQNIERIATGSAPHQDLGTPNPLYNVVDLFNKANAAIISPNPALITELLAGLKIYGDSIINGLLTNPNNNVRAIAATQKKTIEDQQQKIKEVFNSPKDPQIDFFNKVIIQQLFKGQINNLSSPSTPVSVSVTNNGGVIANLKIVNNNTTEFTGSVSSVYSDAVLIESPITLQMLTFIVNGLAFGGNAVMPPINLSQPRIAGLPLHFYDLVNKIVNNGGNVPSEEFISSIEKVEDIIGGRVYYDPISRSILFNKEGRGVVKDYNIASGIKAFGTLGLLLSENILNKSTLLIIDEPEVHLHPNWEIEYAKIIVTLSKMEIPILLSTHSYYFIQQLVAQIKAQDAVGISKFYFGEKQTNGTGLTKFKDVTDDDDLTPIFEALAAPMRTIINNE